MSDYKSVKLEDRLIDFALGIINLCNQLPKNSVGKYVNDQMTRSSLSSAFNYGEAQSGESRKDFIHKMAICLKELRETMIGIKVIKRGKFKIDINLLNELMNENNELISIFVKSIKTAKKNNSKIK